MTGENDALELLEKGLWRWTARHPDWHPRTELGAQVACFALHEGADTILVDPLLPKGGDDLLDDIVQGSLTVLVTIPYHVRSAEAVWRRYGDAHPTTILGHAAVARRLASGAPFRPVAPGDELPHGISAHAVGSPRRQELPLHLPGARALAFGDAVVGAEGGLRVWLQAEPTDRRLRWHRDRFVPTLEPLLELDVERVLVTHGPPVLRDGRRALRDGLAAPPFVDRPLGPSSRAPT